MPAPVYGTSHGDKRKLHHRIVIPPPMLIPKPHFFPDLFLLLRGTVYRSDHVIRIRERAQDPLLILPLIPCHKRNRRVAPAKTVRLIQIFIERE